MRQHDVVILGGGPAGSTTATLLALQGFDVVVLERDHFPRFHIGESLLPATIAIFERLGVHKTIAESCIRKPGGKWLYGRAEVPGDFSKSGRDASFTDTPYSYLVDRAKFDDILIRRSGDVGADVRFGCEVRELVRQDGRIVGVQGVDDDGNDFEVRGRLIVDATGLRALIPSKLGQREIKQPQRMGIYAQYSCQPRRDDVRDGWFTGQMFYDGWTWLLRISDDRYSVGAVLTVDRFRRSGLSPEALLERLVTENELLNTGMSPDRQRVSDVMVTGNMASSSTSLAGDGWVAIGDAAFFIDPCYSSGVHLAMKSAETIADLVADEPKDCPVQQSVFADYEAEMRRHESSVHKMVDAFYIASRHTSVQKMVTKMQGGYLTRQFVTFVGGDFLKNAGHIARIRACSKIVGSLFGNNQKKAPENHPEYLHQSPGDSGTDSPSIPEDDSIPQSVA
jgi:halogenation protein CepH